MKERSGEDQDARTLRELEPHECMRLMASQSVGRLALGRGGQAPLVLPVNFAIDSGAIVFRSDPGTKADLARRGPASFEVDWLDPFHREGWSVLVSGDVTEITDEPGTHPPLEPWADGEKPLWLRMVITSVSGRRLSHGGQAATDGRGR